MQANKPESQNLPIAAAATVVGFIADSDTPSRAVKPEVISLEEQTRAKPIELLEGLPVGYTDVPGYDVYEFVGRGAHAVVYRARQRDLHRIVALKFLVSRTPRDIARFRAEAESVAKLHHPNIVQIHEFGEHRGYFFLALEYVDGGRLNEWVARKPIPSRQAANICMIAAEAMQYAHSQGVVHRDLKPSNIMMDRKQLPKIVDFGIAKHDSQDQTFTQHGELVGTPAYMSPEQAKGELASIGPATDIHAIGVILYELLTGFRPFVAPNTTDVLHKVIHSDAIRPSQLQSSIPIDLETICLKCLEKEPTQRYATAGALASDLKRFLEDIPIEARRTSRIARLAKWAKRRPAMAALCGFAVVSLICAVTGLSLALRSATQLANTENLAFAKEANLRRQAEESLYSSQIGQADLLVEKSDVRGAKQVLDQCIPEENGRDLRGWEWNYVHRLLNSEERSLNADGWIHEVECTPNGKYLIAATGHPENNRMDVDDKASKGKLQVWDANSLRLIRTLDLDQRAMTRLKLSPDSKHVLARSISGIWRLCNIETGEVASHIFSNLGELQFLNSERILEPRHDGLIRIWSVSPLKEIATLRDLCGQRVSSCVGNQQHIAFADYNVLKVADANTGKILRTWKTGLKQITFVQLAGNGKSLAYEDSEGAVHVQDLDADAPRFREQSKSPTSWKFLLSYTGRYVGYSEYDREITLVDTTNPSSRCTFTVLPDITFANNDTLAVVRSHDVPLIVYELPTFRRVSTPATPFEGACINLKLSSDEKLAAACGMDGTVRVWQLGDEKGNFRIRGHEGSSRGIAFHPDGKRLFSGGQDGIVRSWDLWKRLRTENSLRTSAQGGEFLGAFRADPSARYVTEMWHQYPMLRRVDRETGKEVRWNVDVSSTIAFPRQDSCFSGDGTTLLAAKGSEPNNLILLDATNGQTIKTLKGHLTPPRRLLLSLDGKWGISYADRIAKSPDTKRELLLWDIQANAILLRKDVSFSVTSLSMSPDAKKFAIFGFDRKPSTKEGKSIVCQKMITYSFPSGEELLTWKTPDEEWDTATTPSLVFASAFKHDGSQLAAGEFQSGKLHFWDLTTNEKRFANTEIRGPRSLTGMTFHPKGDRLAVNDYLGLITIWNAETAAKLITIKAAQADGRWDDFGFTGSVHFSLDGDLLFANSWHGAINIWDGAPVSKDIKSDDVITANGEEYSANK